ncbi:MAG: DNA translocase FtsK 4TM domain-containing protein, partial [Marinobacter sp.]|nr:DNA translocase FtsK 4TM domain-containing protein [Marinobacter sp.]
MAETANAKKTPRDLTEKQQRFHRLVGQGAREGAVIALIALTIYLAMALVTFTPGDPGWASIGHDTTVRNYAGRTGAWLASLLMDFFGAVAYLFPMMVAGYAVMLIRRRNDSLDLHWPLFLVRFGGFLLILLSATSLLSLYSVFGLTVSSGGVLGAAVSDAMVRFFNLPATTLLLIAIFLFALTVTTGLSWFWLMDQVGGLTLRVGEFLKGLWSPAKVDKSGSAAQPEGRPEKKVRKEPPPIVNDRVEAKAAKKARSKTDRWWHRIPGFKRRKVAPEKPDTTRLEPAVEGMSAPPASEPERLEHFTASDGIDDTMVDRKPAPKPKKASDEAPARSFKISPFKKDEPTNREPGKGEKQGSLLADIESPIPPISLLDPPEEHKERGYSEESLEHMSRLLEEKLGDFGVSVEVVEVNPGPVITRFEIKPAPGVKVSKISNLAKDLARSLAVLSVRVVEVIPGKSVVGIEIPNEEREMVRLSEVLGARVFTESSSPLTLALGNDIG